MSKDHIEIDCVVCGSNRTFKEDGMWHCHNCGSHDVQMIVAQYEDTHNQIRSGDVL
ncbi:hypothetical protein MKZ21_30615 [Paenibacillus sp. FSL P2-0536]|uniref:hypothetical protein n=1 Tax=Paenibacillus sp. FSL P2-0536 TaxID=2921629 RepID=UPI0030FD09D8